MTNTIKAKTVTIIIGDQEVECLVMPNGEYKIAFTQVARLFQYDTQQPARDFKALLPKAFQYDKTRTDLLPRAIPVLSLIQFGILTCMIAAKGNKLATAHLAACQAEAIESRIDEVLNIEREIKEKNEKFVTRRDSILSRHFWTDCIEHYLKNNEVSDNYKKFIYHHVSDYLNRSMFGMTSKQLKEHYGITTSPRDYFPSDTLKLIDTIEKATAVRVNKNDVCPKQALKDVVGLLGIEPDKDLL